MEGQRAFVFLILLLFILFSPDQTPRQRLRFVTDDPAAARQQDFDVIANSTYGDLSAGLLNLTGFRDDDGYQWNLLPKVQDLSLQLFKQPWGDNEIAFYDGISGWVEGKFQRSKLSNIGPTLVNLTAIDGKKEYLSDFWQRNITEDEGLLQITLHDQEDTDDDVRRIKAEIAIETESSPGNGWNTYMRGVHFPNGHAILSTSSTKFNSWPALPHFALDQSYFERSRQAVNDTVNRAWNVKLINDDELFGVPSCELILWLQPKPLLQDDPKRYLQRIEKELLEPDGALIPQIPPLTFSAVLLSPDCGYILEAETLVGPKSEAYKSLAGRLIFAFVIILCLQITLLKRQMKKASTPSTRSRIAYQGIGIAAYGDGLILFGMIAILMMEETGFLVVAAASFLSCIHVGFLEVKFVLDIWTVQVGDPQRAEQDRQRRERAQQQQQRPTQPPPAGGTLPLPATAPRVTDGAVPIIVAADGMDLEIDTSRSSFASVYSRFYFSLILLMFFSLWAISWPKSLRSGYANLLIFCYFSLWWPQVYRNVIRNCRKALSWEYVVGTTMLRTVPVMYWYFVDHNILSIETSPTTAVALLGWLWLQICVLASQQFLGPRLLVKDSWCPPAYDYHPALREDDVEAAGMSIGQLASASEAKDKDDKTRKVFDCAICMNEIDVPVLSNGEQAKATTWLERANYMVTPCRHIFHAECLEGWMNLRLVCPVCRESLPPL